jgi:hypothetical protein
MVHTYREKWLARKDSIVALLLGAVVVGVFVLVIGGLMIDAFARGAMWEGAGIAAFNVVLAVTMYESGRRACDEIRLSDDGTCELETKRRVIRLHVSEISAVEYRDDDETGESYTIRFRGGKTWVSPLVEQFPDFLARLESLNPAVDLSSFPAAWPDREPAEPSRTGFGDSLRSAVFPVVVITFLALIAWHTLSS